MRLAEIKIGFFSFLARVFDSWAEFLRPPVVEQPAPKDPFVSQPPAHWLEMTAGLTFTEMSAEQTGSETTESYEQSGPQGESGTAAA